MRSIFAGDDCAAIKSIRPDIGNTWFVSFENEDDTLKTFFVIRERSFRDQPVRAGIKSENLLRPTYNPAPRPPMTAIPMVPTGQYPAVGGKGAFPAPGTVLPEGFVPQPYGFVPYGRPGGWTPRPNGPRSFGGAGAPAADGAAPAPNGVAQLGARSHGGERRKGGASSSSPTFPATGGRGGSTGGRGGHRGGRSGADGKGAAGSAAGADAPGTGRKASTSAPSGGDRAVTADGDAGAPRYGQHSGKRKPGGRGGSAAGGAPGAHGKAPNGQVPAPKQAAAPGAWAHCAPPFVVKTVALNLLRWPLFLLLPRSGPGAGELPAAGRWRRPPDGYVRRRRAFARSARALS